MALGLIVGFAGCTVYDDALLDSATGTGGRGSGATGGGALAGKGGSLAGSAGVSVTGGSGGASGGSGGASGASGGAGPMGGTGAMEGGSNGEGGEGDQGAGGSSGVGQGGTGGVGAAGGASGGTGGTSGAGSGGVGGTSGAGSGGVGGTSGAGTGGASGAGTGGAGGAGTGGVGGTSGAGAGGAGAGGAGPEVCSGCARLSVPLDADPKRAHYCLTLSGLTDFSTAIITFRVARFAGTGGAFRGYIQHGGTPDYLYQDGANTPVSSIGTTPQNIVWDLSTVTTFDKTVIARVGLEVTSVGSTAWTNPTVLYVDSVTVTGSTPAVAAWTFDTSATVYTTPVNTYGTGAIWLNSYSADTTATGSAISWLGP